MKGENAVLLETVSADRAVLIMSVPMIISQSITIVYNVADTFFVGQMNDPKQVAAVTVALPLFYFLTALANLFGVEGTSVVSRFLGAGDRDRAAQCASFCIWTASWISVLYGTVVYFLRPALLPVIGADANTSVYVCQYVFWTISIGALPIVLNPMLANLIRAEGYSRQAGFGVAFGGILNILLDPVLIFLLRMQIEGAAIATMLSAWLATLYFLLFLRRKKKSIVISFNIRLYSLRNGVPRQILLTGFPNFVISFMATLSNAVLNPLVGHYSNEALAGIGIAKKIDLLAFAIAQGMTQGTLPLLSYSYASGDKRRMREILTAMLLYRRVNTESLLP